MSDDLTRLTDEEQDTLHDGIRIIELGRPLVVMNELVTAVGSILAARTAALIDRVERAERERDGLAQAMWDGWAALGFDTDGDTHPGAWIAGAKSYRSFAEDWLRDVRQHRKEADEADAEWSQDIDRLDATVAELAALRAAVTGLADELDIRPASVSNQLGWLASGAVRDRLRGLLTDEGDNG